MKVKQSQVAVVVGVRNEGNIESVDGYSRSIPEGAVVIGVSKQANVDTVQAIAVCSPRGANQVQQAVSRAISSPRSHQRRICRYLMMVIVLFGCVAVPVIFMRHMQHAQNPNNNSNTVACEGSVLQIRCPYGFFIQINDAVYGRQNQHTCSNLGAHWQTTSCATPNTTDIVSSLCNGRSDCAVSSTNDVFGDPCVGTGKYLEVSHKCLAAALSLSPTPTFSPEAFSSVVCEGSSLEVSCPAGSTISVVSAMYGRTNPNSCGRVSVPDSGCESLSSTHVVSELCNGHSLCVVTAGNAVFGDPCVGTYKYLNVTHNCFSTVSTPATGTTTHHPTTTGSGTPHPPTQRPTHVTPTTSTINPPTTTHVPTFVPTTTSFVTTSGPAEFTTHPTFTSIPTPIVDPIPPVLILVDPPMFQLQSLACEGSVADITCPTGSVISIVSAMYGRSNTDVCGPNGMPSDGCGAPNSFEVVATQCNGNSWCSVSSSNDVFGDPCYGTYKYLEITHKCVGLTTYVSCEGAALEISCPEGSLIHIGSAMYGRNTSDMCPSVNVLTLDCKAELSTQIVTSLCDGNSQCSVQSNNGVFGDPCVGTYKYLQMSYACVSDPSFEQPTPTTTPTPTPTTTPFVAPSVMPVDPPMFQLQSLACEGSVADITCPTGSVISIVSAMYGRSNTDVCGPNGMPSDGCGAPNSFEVVATQCNGNSWCSVSSSNDVFGDPCYGTYKYLEISYMCS